MCQKPEMCGTEAISIDYRLLIIDYCLHSTSIRSAAELHTGIPPGLSSPRCLSLCNICPVYSSPFSENKKMADPIVKVQAERLPNESRPRVATILGLTSEFAMLCLSSISNTLTIYNYFRKNRLCLSREILGKFRNLSKYFY